ncbi:conserved hypothetical protein [Gluconacetobacter diazotrophicus PA1 5]|uniref:Uncharacterized protein n=3 Tax=Gluconacetobacter diazotrophicus TaxID=33996 RepID=A0A7W4I758_GLUDI|nr:hypothetical protein [Gluconacetobacter diazotrophicus]ACI52930.1 conserved hypothetical protein [Gluconacetobacter diazotrophicus PA1 5]MBB2157523.1 hypothetical protein [Gluconacetobacter diazotrophicus]TWB08925.1 hypothetical protein FBZ86_10525 [Gluconacetobacter diazotrophicus]
MKGRRMRDVISGLLVVCMALGAGGPAWARDGQRHAHRRTGLAAHLCATHDAVITTPGHRLRAVGRRRYFAPIGQAMYYRDTSRRCQLRRTAHRHS